MTPTVSPKKNRLRNREERKRTAVIRGGEKSVKRTAGFLEISEGKAVISKRNQKRREE